MWEGILAQSCTLEILSARTGVPVETLIRDALVQHEGAVAKAARTLGVSRQALYLRIENKPELREIAGRRPRRAVPR